MKLSTSSQIRVRPAAFGQAAAFTMIEIALCLAIIGFALIAIIGVLPYGMGTQRDNRQETIIGQDAKLLVDLIRSGSHGANDLTNYVYAITNTVTYFNNFGVVAGTDVYGYTYNAASKNGAALPAYYHLDSGTNIIGLLSTPEFTTNPPAGPRIIPNVYNGGYSNHVVAYVRALSGLAAEKPPQDNAIMRDDSFAYRLFVVNSQLAQDTNAVFQPYNLASAATLHEIRMTFLWPQLPNGKVGNGRQTFRTAAAGDLKADPFAYYYFFYQPQSFSPLP